ncbi:MAG: PQQ-dependent sugar dehydrogenase [Acidobacteria bacterium]|nr:PQQ-dependent sugar dehydrogenase [Acidobacteriota bacterium]
MFITETSGKLHLVSADGQQRKDVAGIPSVSSESQGSDRQSAGAKGFHPAVWSDGHRNPLGLAFEMNGNLWEYIHAARGRLI